VEVAFHPWVLPNVSSPCGGLPGRTERRARNPYRFFGLAQSRGRTEDRRPRSRGREADRDAHGNVRPRIVKHLGWVERGWFREIFAGEDVEAIGADDDDSAEFATDDHDTAESVLAFYRAEVEEARRVTGEAPSLDALSAGETKHQGQVSLRWIMVHMLEETARHAGHLDLIREDIDGQVGD
jgi:hypothetical protein